MRRRRRSLGTGRSKKYPLRGFPEEGTRGGGNSWLRVVFIEGFAFSEVFFRKGFVVVVSDGTSGRG